MIVELKKTDVFGLNSLSPTDWKFDYESFLKDFLTEDFFYAFVIVQEEERIGTGNVFLKGKIGWLANIIVDERHRGKGLGLKMTRFLVEFLKSKGCETQLLIATELGEPVYLKAGFKKVTAYEWFDAEIKSDVPIARSIRELEHSDLKEVYRLDKDANGENRAHLIGKYCSTGLGYFNVENELLGFYLPDFGQGLILSREKQAGVELLKLKHSEKGRKTLLPIENQDGVGFLKKIGLKEGARCSRMILGKENHWKPEYIYSYGSGYCG